MYTKPVLLTWYTCIPQEAIHAPTYTYPRPFPYGMWPRIQKHDLLDNSPVVESVSWRIRSFLAFSTRRETPQLFICLFLSTHSCNYISELQLSAVCARVRTYVGRARRARTYVWRRRVAYPVYVSRYTGYGIWVAHARTKAPPICNEGKWPRLTSCLD